MQVMKWSVMALAIAAATSQMAYADDQDDAMASENVSSQAASNGFIEDSDFTLLNRNFAFYRDFRNGRTSSDWNVEGQEFDQQQNYRNEWAHGFMTTFTSGFTQGVVGFGLDAFGNVGLKLNSGAGTGGTKLLPVQDSNPTQGQDEYGIAGGAVKARVSETVLAFGQQRPESPVFGTSDARLLPSYATGTTIASDEISGLHFQGGYFYSGSGENSTNQDGELSTTYGGTDFNTAEYAGFDYSFSDDLSMGLHAAKYSDVWNQYYADLYHTFSFSDDVSLSSSLNYYNTQDTGKSNAGEISNNTYSAAFALAVGPQTFTLAHQRVNGDTPFDYVNVGGSDGGSIWLANSVQISDFNAPGEKSYQARYDLDMSDMVTPGLSFMVRYIRGSGADGTKADQNGAYWTTRYDDGEDADPTDNYASFGKSGSEWERNIEVKYVVPEGAAKDLSIRVRHATYRQSNTFSNAYRAENGSLSTGIDEVRIITEYPLDIL